MIDIFKSYGLTATPVNTTKDHLQKGDIVQTKNSASTFLVYLGKDSNGHIILEDVHDQFECSPESFDLLFTGNTILLNHTASGLTVIDATGVNDNPTHDSKIQTAPMRVGMSTLAFTGSTWSTAYNRQDFRDRAKQLVNGKNNNYDKVNAIFKYVRDSYDYQFYFGSTHGVDRVVKEKKRNCCELARMEYCLTRAAIDQGLT